jgi:predicted house-cleaning noncanonical NTP pyrophosphatase (MazG superfamily)
MAEDLNSEELIMPGNDFRLVRDRVPEKIRGQGRKCITRSLPPEEFALRLEYALIEELERYLESKDTDKLVDLLETIKALAGIRGVSWDQLEAMRAAKAVDEGGFDDNLLMMWVEDKDLPRKRLLCTCERGDHIFEED